MRYFARCRAQPKRGFTLIELLVVIAIIGLLASIIFASLAKARLKAAAAKAAEDEHSMVTALELYYENHGDWPVSGGLSADSTNSQGKWALLGTYLQPYLASMPYPSYQSVGDSRYPGVVVSQGYLYDKGTATNPVLLGVTSDSCTSNCTLSACVSVRDGYFMDFILPPGNQSALTLNDNGIDTDGIERYDGNVVFTINPTAAQLTDNTLCPP